jgi:hypothetical protein
MSVANPLWGAPRIHGELLKLGIDVGQTTVAKYMARRRRPPSQGWKTFLRNHADGIASMDLFLVPTISFRLLYGFLIVQHNRRKLLWLAVTAHPSAEWIARQLTEAYGWQQAPRYIIRDRDRVYGGVFARRVRAMGIRDRPIAPHSPWQNGCAERLIGSIRRDCLDHVCVWRAAPSLPSEIVSKILQRGAHAPVLAKGRADPPFRPDRRSDVGRANIGRAAPPIYPSVSFRQGHPTTHLALNNQLTSERGILSLKSADRSERRNHQPQKEEEQRDHRGRRYVIPFHQTDEVFSTHHGGLSRAKYRQNGSPVQGLNVRMTPDVILRAESSSHDGTI